MPANYMLILISVKFVIFITMLINMENARIALKIG